MTSSKLTNTKLTKTSNRPLVLMSAALLLQTGGVLVAARAGDAQTQARELLTQTTGAESVAARFNALPDGESSLAARDPQEQARRVILGTQSAGGSAKPAAPRFAKSTSLAGAAGREHGRAYPDAQEMARRMILGTGV
jgi:hypothetical protein